MRFVFAVLSGLTLLAYPLVDQTGLAEIDGEHHEHEGITDAHAEDAGHHHGDADDHHEEPDSPCHHHVVHCCCAHSHTMVSSDPLELFTPRLSNRISDNVAEAEIPPFPKSIFHVPLA